MKCFCGGNVSSNDKINEPEKNNNNNNSDDADNEEVYRLPELDVIQSGMNYSGQNITENTDNSEVRNVDTQTRCQKIAKIVSAFIISTICPVILACIFPEVKPVLGIAGSLGGCMVDFTLPSALYFIYRKHNNTSTIIQQVLCIICFVFGFVSAVIATWQAIEGVIDSFK